MSPEPRAAPGALLGGRFRLERVIGTGGMASVWLGRDESLDRPIAVKIMAEALAHDESYLERFRREATTAAGVTHPNLVGVFDFDASGPRPYLVMEFVEGRTLGAVIELEPERIDAERVARELLGALRRIHEAGIVHRDVKPQNILVGDDGRLRLTDFGIAQPEDAASLTGTGQVLGTFRYLAPEVRVGETATERSDLYSAGIVLRECLGPEASGALAELTARMIEVDPDRRPSSAAVALSEIEDTGRMPADLPTKALATQPASARDAPDPDRPAPLPPQTDRVDPPPPPPAPVPRRTLRSRLAGLSARQVAVVGILTAAVGVAAVAALGDERGRPLLTHERTGEVADDPSPQHPLIQQRA